MILIHTGGNEKIGVGNLSRCRTLANSLSNLGRDNIYMIYEASNEVAKNFLPKEEINLFIVQSREEALEKRQFISNINNINTKVLITDIYELTKQDEIFARNQGFNILMHMNDSSIPEYSADYMIDQEAFIKPWLHSDKIKFIRGGKYSIIRPQVTELRPIKPWNKSNVEKVLLCFGGSDPDKCIEGFIKHIKYNRNLDDIRFDVIVGPGVIEDRWINIKKNVFNNVNFLRNPANLPELMSKSDVLITIGGITSYEGMCLGKPVLCVSCGKMGYYIEELEKINLVKNLGSIEVAFTNLYDVINDINLLKRLADNGFNQVDDKGSERISRFILEVLNDLEGKR